MSEKAGIHLALLLFLRQIASQIADLLVLLDNFLELFSTDLDVSL